MDGILCNNSQFSINTILFQFGVALLWQYLQPSLCNLGLQEVIKIATLAIHKQSSTSEALFCIINEFIIEKNLE